MAISVDITIFTIISFKNEHDALDLIYAFRDEYFPLNPKCIQQMGSGLSLL